VRTLEKKDQGLKRKGIRVQNGGGGSFFFSRFNRFAKEDEDVDLCSRKIRFVKRLNISLFWRRKQQQPGVCGCRLCDICGFCCSCVKGRTS